MPPLPAPLSWSPSKRVSDQATSPHGHRDQGPQARFHVALASLSLRSFHSFFALERVSPAFATLAKTPGGYPPPNPAYLKSYLNVGRPASLTFLAICQPPLSPKSFRFHT